MFLLRRHDVAASTNAVEENMPSGRRNGATRTMMRLTMPCNVSICSLNTADQKGSCFNNDLYRREDAPPASRRRHCPRRLWRRGTEQLFFLLLFYFFVPSSFEWHHFVDRSASFLQQLSSMPRHRVGEAKMQCSFPSICPKLTSRPDGGGTNGAP